MSIGWIRYRCNKVLANAIFTGILYALFAHSIYVQVMLRFIKRHPVWVTLLLLVVGPASLNVSGFCWAEKRWLGDDEKIKAAIVHIDQPGIRYIDGKSVERIPYGSKEAFLKENPDCCYFGQFPTHFTSMPDGHYAPHPSFIEKITGYQSDIINMQYLERFINENKVQDSKKITVQFWLSNCGKGGRF